MENNGTIPREDLVALNDKYREIKHDINNTIAVLMAMAEMSRLKEEYKEKLVNAVITRSQQIAEQLLGFQKLMNETIASAGPGPTTPKV